MEFVGILDDYTEGLFVAYKHVPFDTCLLKVSENWQSYPKVFNKRKK